MSTDFKDGVYLCIIMGLLGGFFVPLHNFHLTPKDIDQMVHNVSFSFELMQDVGLPKPKARPEGIYNVLLLNTPIPNQILFRYRQHGLEVNSSCSIQFVYEIP